MDAGLLPIKRLDRAKTRLGPVFSEAERRAIATALMDDAFELCASVDFLRWWVVSDDTTVLQHAAGRGFATIHDGGSGVNEAVKQGVKEVLAEGATSVTVIPSDVPLAWKGDLRDLLDTGATSDVVVVPSQSDGGTNGLYLSPPDIVEPHFGPSSLKRHIASAGERKLRCSILPLARLALDIDRIEDVDAYLGRSRHAANRTSDVLERLRSSA